MTLLAERMCLRGRRALVSGATGKIGSVIAITLAEMGADLILTDQPKSDFGRLIQILRKQSSVDVVTHECNLADEVERNDLVQVVTREYEELSILVNNAAFVGTSGLDGWVTEFENQSVATWRMALELNLTAPFDLCKGLAPLLKNSRGGSIINIGSIYGSVGPDHRLYADTEMGNPAAYAASKGGLIQFSRWLATTLAPDVRVNCISPGGVFRNQPESFVHKYEQRTPLARMAKEEDLCGALAFLASDMSAYCTGLNLTVDGGWGVW